MRYVSRDNVSECIDRERIPTRSSSLTPCVCRKSFEERQCRQSDVCKLLFQFAPGSFIRIGRADANVLIKTWHRISKPTSEPKGAMNKHSLTVVDVIHHFANR